MNLALVLMVFLFSSSILAANFFVWSHLLLLVFVRLFVCLFLVSHFLFWACNAFLITLPLPETLSRLPCSPPCTYDHSVVGLVELILIRYHEYLFSNLRKLCYVVLNSLVVVTIVVIRVVLLSALVLFHCCG